MSVKELWLTNTTVTRMLGLRPILDAIPEFATLIADAPENGPSAVHTKEQGCCGDRAKYTLKNPPPSAAKKAAVLVQALPEAQKQIVLAALGIDRLMGFIDLSPVSHKTVVLAEKRHPQPTP